MVQFRAVWGTWLARVMGLTASSHCGIRLPCCPHRALWPQLEIPRESLQNGQVLTVVPYQMAPRKPLGAPCPAHTDCLACLLHALAVQPKWAALMRVCLHSTGTAATRALLLSKGTPRLGNNIILGFSSSSVTTISCVWCLKYSSWKRAVFYSRPYPCKEWHWGVFSWAASIRISVFRCNKHCPVLL